MCRECVFGSKAAEIFAKEASDIYCHNACGREIMGSELYRRGSFGMRAIKTVFAARAGGLCEVRCATCKPHPFTPSNLDPKQQAALCDLQNDCIPHCFLSTSEQFIAMWIDGPLVSAATLP